MWKPHLISPLCGGSDFLPVILPHLFQPCALLLGQAEREAFYIGRRAKMEILACERYLETIKSRNPAKMPPFAFFSPQISGHIERTGLGDKKQSLEIQKTANSAFFTKN